MSEHRQGERPRRPSARSSALLGLTAVLLAPSALLNGLAATPSTAAFVVAGVTTVGALAALTVWTVRVLLPSGVMSGARHVLDVVGALLLAPAITLGLALHPLVETSLLPVVDAAVLLAVPSQALVTLVVLLSALRLYWDSSVLRTALVTTVVTVVMLTWATGAAVAGGLGIPAEGRVALVAGAVLTLGALLALAVLAPARPPARRPREDMVMYGRVGQLAVGTTLLGLSHALALPTVAVVLALTSTAVHLVGITLVHAQVGSLSAGRRLAAIDELTGLGNRRALTDALGRVGAGEPLAVVLLDLDRFTSVNGAVGQRAGDELLRQVAGRLGSLARTEDLVVRQGGDEFAIVLAGAGSHAAADRAREVVAALCEPFVLHPRTRRSDVDVGGSAPGHGHAVRIGASIGVASRPDDATGTEELLRAADAAMYLAKRAGGGVAVHGHPAPAAGMLAS